MAARMVNEPTTEVFRNTHLSPQGNRIVARELLTWMNSAWMAAGARRQDLEAGAGSR